MDSTQRGIMVLLRSAVTGVAQPLPADFDLEAVRPYVRTHHILPLVYEGARLCGVQSPLMGQLFSGYCKALQISEGQMQALGEIFAIFEAEGIDYMPLKGCRMKKLYPKPELRMMGDADVLIRMDQYDRIVPMMEGLGFVNVDNTDHELIWKKPLLVVELHKRVIPSYNKDYFRYFGDGWQLATRQEGHCFAMSDEDAWIYELTHFAKHFRDGGIGCRHVLDLWVYRNHHPEMDEAYIRQELEALGLWEFHQNVCALTRYWFEDGQAEEAVELMSEYVLASGSWGQMEERVRSLIVRDRRYAPAGTSGKVIYIFKKLFPPVQLLEKKYTILQKAPWMLPVVWLVRPFYKVFFEWKTLDTQKRELEAVDEASVERHHEMLKKMGIDYRF